MEPIIKFKIKKTEEEEEEIEYNARLNSMQCQDFFFSKSNWMRGVLIIIAPSRGWLAA